MTALSNTFSQCPIRICVITVVILGVLPLMTVFSQDEPQQSPRLPTVTKASSLSGTTSTVRPWPSHSFFRSVLSKTDNVVVKKRNGSNPIRKRSHKTGMSVQQRTSENNYLVHGRKIGKTIVPEISNKSQVSGENITKHDEYSQISSPKVGFQYKIVVPPPVVLEPRPFSTTTTPISTALQYFYHNNGSSVEEDDGGENNRNTSNSTIAAVNMNDMGKNVTNDDTTTTTPSPPPQPLESQAEESGAERNNAETAKATKAASSSNGTILQNPQFPSMLSPPPTQTLQLVTVTNPTLDVHLRKENGESITYNNKIHTEIKKNDPFTINHNSGNIDSANSAFTTASTYEWKIPPTRFSFQHTTPFTMNISNIQGPHQRRKINFTNTNVTELINRRNMFTVVKTPITNSRIRVESSNVTTTASTVPEPIKSQFFETLFHDRTNQVERPSLDNDYFDEDDSQKKLHHWIESEQGHFVTPSTELPRFTNLTWPYYITNETSVQNTSSSGGGGGSASTALSVSFSSKGKDGDKTDFNTQFEFYIPSAAADPHQNPILLAKKKRNKTTHAPPLESWTRIPTLEVSTIATNVGKVHSNDLKQSDHKSKIKHSHWGSKGLSGVKPQNYQKVKSPYESSTGSPKSTLSSSPFTIFTIPGNKRQNYFSTSPVVGHSETVSFVTSKTPTNIFYKPTINHFTASLPFHENTSVFSGGTGAFVATTMQPPSTRREEHVGGGNNDDDTFTNSRNKTILGTKLPNIGNPGTGNGDNKNRILFKVWNLVNGKLKLENQREIPAWALDGYSIPASGTILNLHQIPLPLRPLVTSALSANTATEYQTFFNSNKNTTNLSYMWKPLPILGNFGTTISSIMMESTVPISATESTTSTPDKSIFDNEFNQIKQPISINYVLWNNPASIHDQSTILSTPQTLLSHQPTPVSYFPSSIITLAPSDGTKLQSSHITNTTPRPTTTTTTPTSSSSSNVDHEKLELLFQKYFQYFITSTPATTTTTSTTRPAVSLANRVTETYGGQPDNEKAWKDLKKLILRLATTKAEHADNNNQASATLGNGKTGDLDYLGNVAAIALIMSYLRNQYEREESASVTSTTPQTPYGVTDDMTPPNKDQLWATVYPLFQHFLNNPNYTFIPPPPPPLHSPHAQVLSESSTLSLPSMTPTSSTPIFFTEPPTGSSNYFPQNNNDFNHYASYYPIITTPRSVSVSHRIITQVPRHGATTQHTGRSEEEFDEEVNNSDPELETTTQKSKTLLLLKKAKKKKKKKLAAGFFGATLLKKISKPIFKMKKKHKKYWLDLKFEVDFIQILKKKLLFLLAYKYMPVVWVLAFGLIPIGLSLVPLLYKLLWIKYKQKKKPKYIKVPVPYPSPYPVPVYKPTPSQPPLHFYDHHRHYPEDVIHVDSPPSMIMDHHYAQSSDTIGNGNEHSIRLASVPPKRGPANSFNYDNVRHLAPTVHQEDQEIHVHIHDEESRDEPQIMQAPVTHFPLMGYTSYTQKDLQPYPVTKSYEVGFDIGKTLAEITNKHDLEILKILLETKKEKLGKLLGMWDLAKYGAAVASEAAVNAMRGSTTPVYSDLQSAAKRKKRKRRRRKRKKRKHPK